MTTQTQTSGQLVYMDLRCRVCGRKIGELQGRIVGLLRLHCRTCRQNTVFPVLNSET